MNKAVPWSIKGIDFDAREAAKEAARRDGVTLGEWMNRAIADRANEMGANIQDFDADERLEAVAAQLARLSSEMDDDAPLRRRSGESVRRQEKRSDEKRSDEKRLDVRADERRGARDEKRFEDSRYSASHDQDEEDEEFAPPREQRRRPSAPFAARSPERLRGRPRDAYAEDQDDFVGDSGRSRPGRDRSADADHLLEQAVAAFEDKAGRVEARTTRAIANVANLIESAEHDRADALAQVDARLAGLEQKLHRGARDSVRPLQGMISSVNDRLAEIETRLQGREKSEEAAAPRAARPAEAGIASAIASASDEAAVRALDARLSGLLSRIDKAEATPLGEARDEQFTRLERRFDALMARLDRQNARHAPLASPQAAPQRGALDGAISAISARQRDLESGAGSKIRQFTPRAAPPPAAPPLAAPPSAPPLATLLDERFEALARQLDRVVEKTAAPAPAAPPLAALLDERFEALARQLDRVAEKSAPPAPAPAPPLSAPPLAALLDERFEALAKKLERPAAPAAPADGRIDRLQHGIESLSGRLEDMRREISAGAALRSAGATVAESEKAGVEQALRELSQRVEAVLSAPSAAGPADLERLRAELAVMSGALADVAPRGAVVGVETALRDLGRRIEQAQDAVLHASEQSSLRFSESLRVSETSQRAAGAGIEKALRDLAGRVDAALSAPSASAHANLGDLHANLGDLHANLGDLHANFGDLRAELSAMNRALSDVAPGGAAAGIESALRELANRVDMAQDAMLRASEARGQPTSSAEIETLARQVAAMGRALEDVAPRSQMASLENAVRALGERIEQSRGEGLRDNVLAPIESLADELRRATAEAGAAANFDGVSRQLRDLEARIDELRHSGGADRADFLRVCDQSDSLRAMIAQAVESMAPMERIERQVADLSDRLETVARETREAGRAQEVGLAQSAAGWRGLEIRLDDLVSRIDRVSGAPGERPDIDDSRFDDLSRRLDFIHQAMATHGSAAEGAGASVSTVSQSLEPLLRSLAEKIDMAVAPQADSRALEALERQMAQVTERLEHGDPRSHANLERAIEDIAKRLDASRETDREASRQAFREALAGLPAATGGEDAAREIAELREKHDASDRRAQQTLTAVHETLEKVVDRLAMLEDDVVANRHAAHFPTGKERRPAKAKPAAAPPVQFDADHFLVEPGANRFAARAAAQESAEAQPHDGADEDPTDEIVLSREDETALKAKPSKANYIDAARRALAARAAAEIAEKTEAESQQRAGGAAPERDGGFVRPLAAGEKAPGRRLPALLLMAGTVLALGAYQAYRIFDTPTPPMQAVGESLGGPAQQQPSVAAQPESSVPASASPSPTAAPTAAPIGAAGPAAASDPAPAPAKPGKGASLIDPLAVGAIAPHVNSMAALQSGAQFASVKDLAEKGDPTSQYDMGVRSFEGRGVARDPLAAIQWFEKAAAQGLAQAQYRLGAIYEKGSGAPRDAYKARDWYEKSALLGNIRAMHNLAVIEAEGVDGKPDYASAAQWFHRAADYGVRDSQYNLAILYARGMGVAQNMSMSYVWFALAAKQGDEDAAKKRDEIAGRLDAATLEGAKKQVEDFHARVAPPSANGNPAASVGPAANGFSQPGAKPAAAKAML